MSGIEINDFVIINKGKDVPFQDGPYQGYVIEVMDRDTRCSQCGKVDDYTDVMVELTWPEKVKGLKLIYLEKYVKKANKEIQSKDLVETKYCCSLIRGWVEVIEGRPNYILHFSPGLQDPICQIDKQTCKLVRKGEEK